MHHFKIRGVFLLSVLLAARCFALDLERHVSFSIPAQPLDAALVEFSKQARLQVVTAGEQVKTLQSGDAVGTLSISDALERILGASGLSFKAVGNSAISVGRFATVEGVSGAYSAENGESLRVVQTGSSTSEVTDSAKGSEGTQLEEVVVTARKRKERAQDVPISIAVVSSEDISRRQLVSAADYLRGIPGVNQVGERNGESIVIRGIETSPHGQNFSSGTTVATYFGETPTTNSAGLGGGANVDIKLVDIQRVEVLRGPQGTAFGNSSLGGAVRTIPVAPQLDQLEGSIGANYALTSGTGSDNTMIQAIGNLPLVQGKLAVRAVGYRFEDSGFYRNMAGSNTTFQSLAASFGAQSFATNKEEIGAARFTGGRLAALFQPIDDLRLTLSYLKQKTETDGQPHSNTGTYDQTMLQVAPEHVVRGQRMGVFDTDIDVANATVEYELGWGSLLATFSHLESDSTYAAPYSPAGVPWSELGTSDHHENSGEIRLTTQLDGAWNFLGGLYAEKLKDEGLFNDYWYGSPESEVGYLGITDRFVYDYLDRRDLKQKAAFGEVSWKFLPRFTLTGGIRAYDYDRDGVVITSGPLLGDSSTPSVGDASGTSLRGNLSYKPSNDALMYTSWSQGFRLGKPQPGLPAALCDRDPADGLVDGAGNITIDSTKSVDSDSVGNYEIGAKLSLLDRRVTIAADVYRIDWSGVPFLVQAPAPCGFVYNANAGKARSEGFEFQASFLVTPALRVDAGGSSIRARLSEDAPNLRPIPGFEGDRLPGSPKINANLGVEYELDLAGHSAFVRADSIYVGSFYGDLQESKATEAGGYVKLDVSARVRINDIAVGLFVHNLTNEDEFTFRGIRNVDGQAFGYRLRPRTIGLQLSYQF
jgi:outer membrane receptor protein involved in Fe transport